MATEPQERYCHGCGHYVQFNLDMELNGNHVLECPNCGHEHCRVVQDGKITSERWDQRNQTYYNGTTGSTTISTWDTYQSSGTANNTFLYTSWMGTTTTTG
jgi:pyruvate/2-oxoacid:ferredoxin oxidoreductase beta subunit